MAASSRRKNRKHPDANARKQLSEYRRKRDFEVTSEPNDAATAPAAERPGDAQGHLQFVIQKHDASSLHYDLRLEVDGVMKSWAVPKGPSLDPRDRRLAMQVEDHPVAYNAFEGTIPQGEYGGGTVMLWDRGTYYPDEAKPGEDHEAAMRRELKAGKLSVTFEGERLRGSFALVRTDPGAKPKWLLIKHRDRAVRPGYDITADVMTSVDTGRTMAEIATGASDVWHSNRGGTKTTRGRRRVRASEQPAPDVAELAIEPMQPRARTRLPTKGDWRYERMPGGRRVLAYVTADTAALIDERGADRTRVWQTVAAALQGLAGRAGIAFVLDGEVVDTDDGVRYDVYDLLLRGDDALLGDAWSDRRAALEALLHRRRVADVALVEVGDDGPAVRERAEQEAWPGFRARSLDGRYSPGATSGDWLEFALDT